MPINLIFDGNYLFHKMRHNTQKKSNTKGPYLTNENDQLIFMYAIAEDFLNIIKKFNDCIGGVFFLKDSKSWRKTYYSEYKSNRVKDDNDLDWNIFYKLMDEFMEIVANFGAIPLSIIEAEGDDLMYLISNYGILNKKFDSIIVTADSDLTQTVKLKNDNFCLVYNNHSKHRKLIAPIGFSEWLSKKNKKEEEIDIFNVSKKESFSDDNKSLMRRINASVEIEEEIDPILVALEKILCGDKKDNVPSVFEWVNKKGNIQRITPKHVQPMYDFLVTNNILISDLIDNEDMRDKFRKNLSNLANVTIKATDFNDKLIRNIHLVYLNECVIPKDLIENVYDIVSKLTMQKVNVQYAHFLLENTRFENKVEVISDIFDL